MGTAIGNTIVQLVRATAGGRRIKDAMGSNPLEEASCRNKHATTKMQRWNGLALQEKWQGLQQLGRKDAGGDGSGEEMRMKTRARCGSDDKGTLFKDGRGTMEATSIVEDDVGREVGD